MDLPPQITAIDHLVLSAGDIDKTIHFYCDILGMSLSRFTPADDGADRLALCFGQQKINLHDAAAPYRPHADNPVAGAVDICLLTDTRLEEWQAHLAAHNIEVEEEPVPRSGAIGPILSLYLRDPDGNLVEIAHPS